MERGCEAGRKLEVVQNDTQCQDYMLRMLNLSVLVLERQITYLSSSFPLSDDS
jgi:hypothetical protein